MRLNLQFPPTPEHAANPAAVCVSAAKDVSGVSLGHTIGSLESFAKGLQCPLNAIDWRIEATFIGKYHGSD